MWSLRGLRVVLATPLDPTELAEMRKKKKELHQAIYRQDESRIFSLAETRPGLDPMQIGGAIVTYRMMRADPRGRDITPLLVAVHFGELEMVRYLLEEEADVNSGRLHGMAALTLALDYKHYEIAEQLLRAGANVHVEDVEGKTPMYYAIQEDSPVSIVKALLSAGVSKNGVTFSWNGSRPVMNAICRGNLPVLRYLLEQSADVNSPDTEGITPLSLAITARSPVMVRLLLKHGACYELAQAKGESPKEMAGKTKNRDAVELFSTVEKYFCMAKEGDLEVVEELKKRVAGDEYLVFMNCINRKGNTMIVEALKSGHRAIAEGIVKLRVGTEQNRETGKRNLKLD